MPRRPALPQEQRSPSKKPQPRIALVGLTTDESKLFSDCCRQLDIQAPVIDDTSGQHFQREKFEGIAVGLDENAEQILQKIRSSPSNRRVLIYAVAGQLRDVFPLAKFGINATFERPLERQNVIKLLRATRMLIVNEFRRYLRIPIVLPLKIETDSAKIGGSTCELSGGGMSLTLTEGKLAAGERASVSFALPGLATLKLAGQVCWRKEAEKTIGVKFDENAPGRAQVRSWIDEFLGIR